MKTSHALAGLAAAALLATLGCSTTRVTNSWQAPGLEQQDPPQKTMVLALFPTESARRTLEDDLSIELRKAGVQAVPANRFIADAADISSEDVQELAQQHGFDSVVLSRYQGSRYEYDYYGGYGGYAPYFGWGGGWYYAPGSIYPREEAIVETSLFDAEQGGQLQWSVTSETVDPDNSEGEMRSIAEKVVSRMEEDAIF